MADIDNEVFDQGEPVKKERKKRPPMSASKKAAFALRMRESREAKKKAKAEGLKEKKVEKKVEVKEKKVEVKEKKEEPVVQEIKKT